MNSFNYRKRRIASALAAVVFLLFLIFPASVFAEATIDSVYYIIAGSFSKKAGADKFSQSLENSGFTTRIIPRKGMYSVAYNSYSTRENAKQAYLRIKDTGKKGWILVMTAEEAQNVLNQSGQELPLTDDLEKESVARKDSAKIDDEQISRLKKKETFDFIDKKVKPFFRNLTNLIIIGAIVLGAIIVLIVIQIIKKGKTKKNKTTTEQPDVTLATEQTANLEQKAKSTKLTKEEKRQLKAIQAQKRKEWEEKKKQALENKRQRQEEIRKMVEAKKQSHQNQE